MNAIGLVNRFVLWFLLGCFGPLSVRMRQRSRFTHPRLRSTLFGLHLLLFVFVGASVERDT